MKKRHTARSSAARQSGGLSHFRLIDDRTAVFAFLAFLVVVLFLFDSAADQQALFSPRSTSVVQVKVAPSSQLTQEMADQAVAKLVIDTPQRDDVAFIAKDTVDPQLLEYFTSMDYDQIKAHLGIQGDFVMHFEDQSGRVIPIGSKFCIGSKDTSVNGVPCG